MTVSVIVNGTARRLAPGATVATLVAELTGRAAGRGVAVALEGEVIPRGSWESTALPDGAEIEVVHAVQGG